MFKGAIATISRRLNGLIGKNTPPATVASGEGGAASQHACLAAVVSHPGDGKLHLILAIVLCGFFASLIFHYEAGIVRKNPYPYDTFLFVPGDQFMDFYNNFLVLRAEGPETIHVGWGSALGTLRARLLYVIFYPRSHDLDAQQIREPAFEGPFVAWCIFTATFVAAMLLLVRSTVRRISPDFFWLKVLVLTFCSYPVLFCLDRSNFENTLFIWIALSMVLYRRGRFFLAAALLGAAIAAKPYAVVFLALYASDRRFKECFYALGVAALLTGISLLLLPGATSVRLHELKDSMAGYNEIYVLGNNGLPYCNSLYGLIKVFIFKCHLLLGLTTKKAVTHLIVKVMRDYFRFALVAFSLIGVLVCGFRMPIWKKLALLVCGMNLLPFISADYRLIHLFIPLLLFLGEEEISWGDRFFCVVFALLLIPKGFVYLAFDPICKLKPAGSIANAPIRQLFDISEAVVVNPLLMLALVVGIAISVLRQPEFSDTALWLFDLWGRFRRRFRNPQMIPATAGPSRLRVVVSGDGRPPK